ncbi:hypothetical protein POM88_050776 [Heracleum sosnowskyi]|uniref:Uncharacterized protein n=1 Tax=Heracleum sosnowskyi TaxID=360622 RepID=A0AAD8H0T2_9APIA|nr:hypothetical protein POM88_050776 [Heracleum sosnowskyi]
MVAEGTVLDVQPVTAIPHQQSTMEEKNYPSEDKIEEVDENLLFCYLIVPSAGISSEISVPDSAHNIDENIEEFVDDISDYVDHSHVKDPNAPTSPQFDYCNEMLPATFDGAQGTGITLEENFEIVKMIGLAENHAAGKKRLPYHTLPDSPQKRKATDEEIARVNQQILEEANEKKTDELVAVRNDVDKLTTKITGIYENVAIMNHQDLVKKVNLLQQSEDAYRETELNMFSLLMEITNWLGNSVDDITKGKKEVGGTSCRVKAVKKVDGGDHSDDSDSHGLGGTEGSKSLQDKSLVKMPESKYSQPETEEEKSSESRKRKRDTTILGCPQNGNYS